MQIKLSTAIRNEFGQQITVNGGGQPGSSVSNNNKSNNKYEMQ